MPAHDVDEVQAPVRQRPALALVVAVVVLAGGLALASIVRQDLEPSLGPGLAALSPRAGFLTAGDQGITVGGPGPWCWLVHSTLIWGIAAAGDRRTLYAGTDSGWVWRSTDGGRHWARADSGLPTGLVPAQTAHRLLYIAAGVYRQAFATQLSVAATNPAVVYVVDGQLPTDLYRSRDGGATWRRLAVPLPADDLMSAVRIDPHDPDGVWVGALRSGLYHSDDGGDTWELVRGGLPGAATIGDVAVSGRLVYVTMMLRGRDGTYAPSTLYRSTDGGHYWTRLQAGLPPTLNLDAGVWLSPVGAHRLYALADGDVVVSADGGARWTTGRGIGAATTIRVDPADPRVAYAVAAGTLYRTTDGGATWRPWGARVLTGGQPFDAGQLVVAGTA